MISGCVISNGSKIAGNKITTITMQKTVIRDLIFNANAPIIITYNEIIKERCHYVNVIKQRLQSVMEIKYE
jgi:hypothetical protein